MAALLLSTFSCSYPEPTRDVPPSEGCLTIDASPARDLLGSTATDRGLSLPGSLQMALPLIAYAADVEEDAVWEEWQRARAGNSTGQSRLTFDDAFQRASELGERINTLEDILQSRKAGIVSRVNTVLPEEAEKGPTLRVVVVVGLPKGTAVSLAPLDTERVLLIDACQIFIDSYREDGAMDADALGEHLERQIAPELFFIRFDDYVARAEVWRDYPMHGDGRRLFVFLSEGVGGFLAMRWEERYDEQGRLPPLTGLRARDGLERFESGLQVLLETTDPEERARLWWTCFNGPPEERWGTAAGTFMVEAVDRFGRPGRLREVLRSGPGALIQAYVEVSGRQASVPHLSPRVRSWVESATSREASASD